MCFVFTIGIVAIIGSRIPVYEPVTLAPIRNQRSYLCSVNFRAAAHRVMIQTSCTTPCPTPRLRYCWTSMAAPRAAHTSLFLSPSPSSQMTPRPTCCPISIPAPRQTLSSTLVPMLAAYYLQAPLAASVETRPRFEGDVARFLGIFTAT